jgi:hypothetical protein
LAKIFSAHGVHGMPSEAPTCEAPTCVRTGGDSADAGIEYTSPEREALLSQQNRILKSKILVAKAQILQSRCSVSALVSALVALFGRNPVVKLLYLSSCILNNKAPRLHHLPVHRGEMEMAQCGPAPRHGCARGRGDRTP